MDHGKRLISPSREISPDYTRLMIEIANPQNNTTWIKNIHHMFSSITKHTASQKAENVPATPIPINSQSILNAQSFESNTSNQRYRFYLMWTASRRNAPTFYFGSFLKKNTNSLLQHNYESFLKKDFGSFSMKDYTLQIFTIDMNHSISSPCLQEICRRCCCDFHSCFQYKVWCHKRNIVCHLYIYLP